MHKVQNRTYIICIYYMSMEPALPEKSRKGKRSSLNVLLSRSLCAFLRDLAPLPHSLSLSLCLRESEMPDDHSTLRTHSRKFRIPQISCQDSFAAARSRVA